MLYLPIFWDRAHAVRQLLLLAPRLLHITLGFRLQDIHTPPKEDSPLADSAAHLAALSSAYEAIERVRTGQDLFLLGAWAPQ